MDRRESLKLMFLAAVSHKGLLERRPAENARAVVFHSQWHQWPDVQWAGPDYWGNRLQDWVIRDGNLVCRTQGPNRILTCLTQRPVGASFSTSVTIDPSALIDAAPEAFAGFRFGLTGRFDDYRSAAVHGVGIDAGIRSDGAVFIGDIVSEGRVNLDAPVRLDLASNGTAVSIRARTAGASEPIVSLRSRNLSLEEIIGNLALVSHFANAPAEGASFSGWTIEGDGILTSPESAFGPIMFAQYTLHRGVLKLTAQLAPIDDIQGLEVFLEVRDSSGAWTATRDTRIDALSRTARFRMEGWNREEAVDYRVRLVVPLTDGPAEYEYLGRIAAEPRFNRSVRAAVFSCNADHGFPDTEVVQNAARHNPDLALFLGDQYYESSGGFGVQRDSPEMAALDMLHKWYMFGWSYRELFRTIPSACIPDDHDVYHGNVWGEGGKRTPPEAGWGAEAQDMGGYKMPAEWVNAVQRTQTSHLPDPYDATPAKQGIGVYYTRWDYGGISFAILEDRKFKSAPKNVLPVEAEVANGWIRNPEFDIRRYRHIEGAELLGQRQMRFLEDWAEDWSGASQMKVVLSQTNFAAVHTIPHDADNGSVIPSLPMPEPGEYVLGDKLSVDMDTNGWPASERDRVLRILQKCSAFHIAGDQHLATVVRHGIDEFEDGCYSFTGPALNNIWPRRWWPPNELSEGRFAGAPAYGGRFRDGFGNRITVYAAANPRQTGLEPAIIRDRVTGYCIVEFDKTTDQIHMECWPRQVNPLAQDAKQYEGWPLTVHRDDGDGRVPIGYLPQIQIDGLERPVVQVRNEAGNMLYARRLAGKTFRPPAFENGAHVIRVGDPDRGVWREQPASVTENPSHVLRFRFSE